MQSRLARRSSWTLSSATRFTLKRGFCSSPRSQTADPAIHSGEREAGPDVHKEPPRGTSTEDNVKNAAKFAETNHAPSIKDKTSVSPKSPFEPSPKLKSTGVNQRLDPNIQQKRRLGSKALEEVSCAGLDGTPWPDDKNKEQRIREEQREDNIDYYKHHKASPLSEIEFVDTRRLLSDYKAGTVVAAGRGEDVIVWLPEQLDTAEDSLRRATEIWRQNAMRGDPDAPHSRVLRALRGEDF
ncbi:uncharacterized protein LOC133297981 [Gastrolobium bilobum]|uniref:uncharacterized protein LOC133297981 n=1 Tax=Gastrolobium bilobum TaxID=150636 RepID=UPI002AB0DF5F|nr:uncharacterized protein LOC133297981 [Gastrolobium bilobum]